MRLCFALAAFAIVTFALPAAAHAACPGYTAAAALRDKAVDAKVHSSKLTGQKAQAAIANLKSGIASAESCVGKGSTADRAAALAVAAQLRWNEACVLSFDGIPADKKTAMTIAKSSDREMDAFSSNHPSLSEDGRILFENWEHFDSDIETGHPNSCVE